MLVDHKERTQSNGGYKACQEFKEASIKEKILNIKNLLICRASSNIVWYYQDQNLYKSFPELFPYGIGSKITDDLNFYKYILSLSNPLFHRGEVTTTIHNMYERKKLAKSACFYTKKENKLKIGDLKNEDFTPEL